MSWCMIQHACVMHQLAALRLPLPYCTFGCEEIMEIKNLRFWWKIRFWFFWVRIGTQVYSEPARFIRPSEAKKITENARMPRASFIYLLNLVAKCTVNIAVSAAPQCPTSTVFCKILYETNFKVVCLPVWSPWCDGQFLCFARGRSWVRTQPRTKFCLLKVQRALSHPQQIGFHSIFLRRSSILHHRSA